MRGIDVACTASPIMTCSECSNQIPEDTTTCSHCGAPVEVEEALVVAGPTIAASTPEAEKPKQVEEGQDTPKLWNPNLIAVFEFPLLGSAIASILVALNWRALGCSGLSLANSKGTYSTIPASPGTRGATGSFPLSHSFLP